MLPEWDMRLPIDVTRMVELVLEARQKGWFTLLWRSLPCTAWSSWQYINCWRSAICAQAVRDQHDDSWKLLVSWFEALRRILAAGAEEASNAQRVVCVCVCVCSNGHHMQQVGDWPRFRK